MKDLQEYDNGEKKNLLKETNWLLKQLNFGDQLFDSFQELEKNASSMFVALFEKIFQKRLLDVIRNPSMPQHNQENAQAVLNELSLTILKMDLSHISGEEIGKGNITSISFLVQIFIELHSLMILQQNPVVSTKTSTFSSATTTTKSSPPPLSKKPKASSVSHTQRSCQNANRFQNVGKKTKKKLQEKASERDARLLMIRTLQRRKDLNRTLVSRKLKEKDQEEKRFKKQMSFALKREKEILKEEHRATQELLHEMDKQHDTKIQSIEKYYMEQIKMVKEKTQEERKNREIVSKAKQLEYKTILQKTFQKYEHELEQIMYQENPSIVF